MKKILLAALTVLAVSSVAVAQDGWPRGAKGRTGQYFVRRADNAGTELSLSGKLEWANGRVALKTEEKTYFVSGLQQLLGFVDGLKEGAQLSLTGRAYEVSYIPEYGFFRAEKVSFNGRDYALSDGPRGFGAFACRGHDTRRGGAAPPGYRGR
ncbi:MAG: hypothetical protein LBO04_07485 [Spirochaetaceae bacterium]|nr:hypothetical protein [Spirochaetaceae bacterium]